MDSPNLLCPAPPPSAPQGLAGGASNLPCPARGAASGSGVPRAHRQGAGPHHGDVVIPSALALPCRGGVPQNQDAPGSAPCPACVPTSSLAPRQGTHVGVSFSLPSNWGSLLFPQCGCRYRLLREQRDQRRGLSAALRLGPRQPHPDRHRLAGRAARQGPPHPTPSATPRVALILHPGFD